MAKKEKEKNSIVNVIKENYGWVIAVITVIGIVILNIFRFVEYINALFYFNYYGIDINLYKYYDQNFLYSLCLSIIFIIAFVFLLYCFKQIVDNIKNKKYICKQNFINILLIILSNMYLVISTGTQQMNLLSYIVSFIIFIITEIILSILVFKKLPVDNNQVINKKEIIIETFKKLSFFIILLIISIGIRTYSVLALKNNYRVIKNEKIIVYSTIDYYITLDCEIKDDELTIYKGTQEKIDTENVYSKLNKYNKIIIK